jgi:hypothetical protein
MDLAFIQPVTHRLPYAPQRVMDIDWHDIPPYNSCRHVTFEEYTSISDNPLPKV